MPTLPPLRQSTQSIYRIEFFSDGFPGSRSATGELIANPIFGRYAIQDFLLQYDQTGESRFLTAAARVADAALGRMEEFSGALVFWYPAHSHGARSVRRSYSGLTQSHYLVVLQRLAERLESSEYADAAVKVLESLRIPASRGGVLYERANGPIIAETPLEPNDVILNGWLTAMVNVWEYWEQTGAEAARALFDSTADVLEDVLPLFDVPELCNSRYGSAGYAWFRLRLPASRRWGEIYSASDVRLDVPGEGSYPVVRVDTGRWDLHAVGADLRSPHGGVLELARNAVRLNLVLNYLSAPEPNVLRLELSSPARGTAVLEMWRAGYDPLSAGPTHEPRWVEVGNTRITPGRTSLSWAIPWDLADVIAYPTSFLKRAGGVHHNVYHFVHIEQLWRLHMLTGRKRFGEYARRWIDYTERWPSLGVYKNVSPAPAPHSTIVRRLLASPRDDLFTDVHAALV